LQNEEEFEDTKGVIRIRKSKKDKTTLWPKEKVQKDKQRSTKHYTEAKRSSNTNHTSVNTNSCTPEEWTVNISVVICVTDIP